MALDWKLVLRGGDFDGWMADTSLEPEEVLIVWTCEKGDDCDGHMTFDPRKEEIIVSRALAYRRTSFSVSRRLALYEVGDVEPDDGANEEARELVGAGATR